MAGVGIVLSEDAAAADSAEYEAAVMEFNRRHRCRLRPVAGAAYPRQLNRVIYEHMQGPNEFTLRSANTRPCV